MKSQNPDPVPKVLEEALEKLEAEFYTLPAFTSTYASDAGDTATTELMAEVATRLGDNYPYFHPLYAGQMLKPPHPIARAAYALTMKINPNNHARDGGRASSQMEIEAVREIAAMFGWEEFLGHLTSGGTFANLEALWVSGKERSGQRILASTQAHYTHQRISSVLGLRFDSVATDSRGRMDLNALEDELKRGDVGTVVVTLGTTANGAVDRLDEIITLQSSYNFRIHVDAAYGGYFKLIPEALDEDARRAYAAIDQADSIVIDPHKHGLQPYGCGCILFRSPTVGRFYKHDSPYTYFTSNELHLGEISLECSRSGAAAVALWTTQRLLPLVPGGKFADGLKASRTAALDLNKRVCNDGRFTSLREGDPELDIVVWKVKDETHDNSLAQKIFDLSAERNLHLALVKLPKKWFDATTSNEKVTCLRSVLMKPEHKEWIDCIWKILLKAADEVLRRQ